MSNHTPGPWENERGTITSGAGLGGLIQVVAECHVYDSARNKMSGAERDRNADLIAAAPDLLSSLAFLVQAAETEPGMAIYSAHLEQAKAAIQKATK